MECPLCGKQPAELQPGGPITSLPVDYTQAANWRNHLAVCAGGDTARSIPVSIPFTVTGPVSPDTNHVTYRNDALGLEYRFYYPEYLDRQKCADRIAKVEPYFARVEGAAVADMLKNELCAALQEWRALVIAKSTAEFDYRAYQKLIEDYCALIHSGTWYRIRQWWNRLLHGDMAAGVRR